MSLSESTLRFLAERGDYDAAIALVSIDIPGDGVRFDGDGYCPGSDPLAEERCSE